MRNHACFTIKNFVDIGSTFTLPYKLLKILLGSLVMLKKDKHNDITDFSILKFLDISIRPKKGSSPIPII